MATVNYQVTDAEVIDSYWFMLKTSRVYLKKILIHCAVFLSLPMLINLLQNQSISLLSIVIGFAFAFIYPFVMVYLARKMARKGAKTISVSTQGMNVAIGDRTKRIDWQQVGGVEENDKYLFILSNAGNFMCIPKRAFTESNELATFKSIVQQRTK
ncbi:MAG: YcxB family protein [Algicola sp.]|nr:YcxB family protein [Algicola sp.]